MLAEYARHTTVVDLKVQPINLGPSIGLMTN